MNSIEIKDLEFSYDPKGQSLLSISDFTVASNEMLFIKGPSGSGKTTLLNLLAGVLSPNKGKLSILGKDFTALTSRQRDQFRSDHMGFIFQSLNLIGYISPIENVLLPLSFSATKKAKLEKPEESAKSLLENLGLEEKDYNKANSLELSQGQQQRVAVARACIGNPEIIIADEPTSALDRDNADNFLNILKNMAEQIGASVLFVSHDSSLEKHFDRVVSLKDINKGSSL